MAHENRSWGYDRIAGALVHLGYDISDQTVGNILKRRGLPPAPERKKSTTWKEFIRSHMDVLVATDFFTTEVWTLGGLVTFSVLFFIELGSRRVHIAGITPHPNEAWMKQVARNVTMEEWGFLEAGQYLIHDRDTKFCAAFTQILDNAGVKRVPLPPRSPHLNAYAERWVRSVKEEALSRMMLCGERSLWHVLTEYVAHDHGERPPQGQDNVLLFPSAHTNPQPEGPLQCRERLSTTSLVPPGAELGDLVGRDEPEHDVLEEPQQHLAMHRREGQARPRGGKSPPGRRAASAGTPESYRPA